MSVRKFFMDSDPHEYKISSANSVHNDRLLGYKLSAQISIKNFIYGVFVVRITLDIHVIRLFNETKQRIYN